MMQINITKKIGDKDYNFTFSGEDLHECVLASQHLAFPTVFNCGFCDSQNLELRAYITEKEKYKYVKIICLDCRASLTLGKTKKDGAYFLRKHSEDKTLEWEKREYSSLAGREEE